MAKSSNAGDKPWVDPDDAPELDAEYFRRADVYEGETLIRRGRPKLVNSKKPISLRLDPEIITSFRAVGPGWHKLINETLKEAVRRGLPVERKSPPGGKSQRKAPAAASGSGAKRSKE